MQEYTTIYDRAEDSFIERKSEFIGHIAPVETEEQALAFIAEIKKKHHDATHNTHAYIETVSNATPMTVNRRELPVFQCSTVSKKRDWSMSLLW